MTTYALFIAFVLLVCALGFTWALAGIYADHVRESRVALDLALAMEDREDADRAVFDTVERWRRDQRVNEIAAEVRGAFLDQMSDPFAATRDEIAALPEVRR